MFLRRPSIDRLSESEKALFPRAFAISTTSRVRKPGGGGASASTAPAARKIENMNLEKGLLSPSIYAMQRKEAPSSSSGPGMMQEGSLVEEVDARAGGDADFNLRILVVGDPKCGKSSAVDRYVNKRFNPELKSNRGMETVKKREMLSVKLPSGKRIVQLSIMDAAGQERLTEFSFPALNLIHGVVIVCDVSREGTVESVKAWKERVDRWAEGRSAPMPIVLFANKLDLLEVKSPEESKHIEMLIQRICSDHALLGMWTSAQTGKFLNDSFNTLVQHMVKHECDTAGPGSLPTSAASSSSSAASSSVATSTVGKSPLTPTRKAKAVTSPTLQVALPTWLLGCVAVFLLVVASTYCYTSLHPLQTGTLPRNQQRGHARPQHGADDDGGFDLDAAFGRQQQEELVSMLLNGGLDQVLEAAQSQGQGQGQEQVRGEQAGDGSDERDAYSGADASAPLHRSVGVKIGGAAVGGRSSSLGDRPRGGRQAKRYQRSPLMALLETLHRVRHLLFGWLAWNPFRG